MRPLNISAISFLNTAPLMWDFEHEPSSQIRANFNITYTVPSQCAKELREGIADIGIVPVITTATIPDLVILPDVAIAARGPVRSILLISKKPIDDVRTVAVDTSSRTSVGLTQVLLTKFFGGHRELTPMAPDLKPMLEHCDASLLIGDPALAVQAHGYHVYDLAEVWREKTGLNFVFAVWAVRRAALSEMTPGLDLARIFQTSRDNGLQPTSIETIAEQWSKRLPLTRSSITSYLCDSIYYHLDASCREGLELYFKYAAECGVIEAAPSLEFL